MLTLLMTTSCSSTGWLNVVPPVDLTAPSHKSRAWIKKNAPLYVKKDVAECIRGARTLERMEEDSSVTDIKFESYWAKIAASVVGVGVFIWDKLTLLFSWLV